MNQQPFTFKEKAIIVMAAIPVVVLLWPLQEGQKFVGWLKGKFSGTVAAA